MKLEQLESEYQKIIRHFLRIYGIIKVIVALGSIANLGIVAVQNKMRMLQQKMRLAEH